MDTIPRYLQIRTMIVQGLIDPVTVSLGLLSHCLLTSSNPALPNIISSRFVSFLIPKALSKKGGPAPPRPLGPNHPNHTQASLHAYPLCHLPTYPPTLLDLPVPSRSLNFPPTPNPPILLQCRYTRPIHSVSPTISISSIVSSTTPLRYDS